MGIGTKIFIAVAAIIYILFILSALGPLESRKKFWIVIHRIRRGMDFCSYWFFNLWAIATVLVILWMIICSI